MDRARSVAYAFTMFGVRPGWLSRPISRPPARISVLGLRDLPPISHTGIRFLIAVIVLLAVSVGPSAAAATAGVGLRSARIHWRPDVCLQLWPAIFGGNCMFHPAWPR